MKQHIAFILVTSSALLPLILLPIIGSQERFGSVRELYAVSLVAVVVFTVRMHTLQETIVCSSLVLLLFVLSHFQSCSHGSARQDEASGSPCNPARLVGTKWS